MRDLPTIPNSTVAVSGNGGLMTRDWFDKFDLLFKALRNRLPLTGAASFSAATTATVTFDSPEADANYDVWFAPPDSKTYWASSKTVNGFTANASSSVTASVRWQLIRA